MLRMEKNALFSFTRDWRMMDRCPGKEGNRSGNRFGGSELKQKAVPGSASADHHIGYLTTLKAHPATPMGMAFIPCHVIVPALETINRGHGEKFFHKSQG